MKGVLDKIISDTQKSFLKGRYIGECTRLIFDILKKTENDNIPGLLLLLDFDKAFDCLEWNFIQDTLKFFGFKQNVCDWVKTLYCGITSCTVNNGFLSHFFPLQRGVRQGDPLSPYLFILCLECLSAAIKLAPKINGVKINNSEYIISQFADDTTMILDGETKSIKETFKILDLFKTSSGLGVNIDKTLGVWMGSKMFCADNPTPELNLDFTRSTFKLLGINFNLNDSDITKCNYQNKIENIKNLLNNWKLRNLTTIGTITVVKSLALSMLVHLFMVLPSPSKEWINELENIFFRFIWDRGKDKVKRTVMYGAHEDGGLKLPHVLNCIKALKLIWIKKLSDPLDFSDWKILFLDSCENIYRGNLWVLQTNLNKFLHIEL